MRHSYGAIFRLTSEFIGSGARVAAPRGLLCAYLSLRGNILLVYWRSLIYKNENITYCVTMGPTMQTEFTPLLSLLGGGLIGASAVLLMATHGRIAGISGIL